MRDIPLMAMLPSWVAVRLERDLIMGISTKIRQKNAHTRVDDKRSELTPRRNQLGF